MWNYKEFSFTACSGNRVYWDCTHDTSTTCVPCPESTFSDEPNELKECFPCTVCDSSECFSFIFAHLKIEDENYLNASDWKGTIDKKTCMLLCCYSSENKILMQYTIVQLY